MTETLQKGLDGYNAEIALLGTLLAYGSQIHNVVTKLQPIMFDQEPNRLIYRAMVNCQKRGVEPSTLIVYEELKNNKWLDSTGGKRFLDLLIEQKQSINSLDEIIKIIQNAYKARELKRINSQIPAILTENNVNEVISDIHRKLNDLQHEVLTPDVTRISDVVDKAFDDILHRVENPGPRGLATGLADIDSITSGLIEGDVWYIGARPSHGKSAILTKITMNMAKRGVPCMIFNREMRSEDIIDRMISIASGVSLQKIRNGHLNEKEIEQINHSKEKVKNIPLYIDNNFLGQVDYITATIRKYHQLYGVRVVGIDYIQLIVERSNEAVHLLGDVSRKLKLLANELGITIIILSQVNRECEKREDKRPLMADLRQSGNMEEDADIMIALYRDEVYNKNSPDAGIMEFIIRKSRNGPTTTIRLRFDEDTVNTTNYGGVDKLWRGDGFVQ